ncbi:hypothetical protein RDI58_024353 [Solanum bulbocastanum]|uniref:Uncharacterized protein n=1 Tax=Solanum bulbocastanum TaxID=147425 RepID=A0AAN8SXH9_SOLBU
MDFTINTVALSEMIPTASIKANPGALVETESPMEVIDRASLTHSTQDTPILYTFLPLKDPMVTRHPLPVYIFFIGPPITKAQEFHHQDVNHYVEIENDTKSIDVEMMSTKMKSLEDSMRGLRGFDSSQSVRCEELCIFPELIGIGNNEGIRINLFNQSLTEKALEW